MNRRKFLAVVAAIVGAISLPFSKPIKWIGRQINWSKVDGDLGWRFEHLTGKVEVIHSIEKDGDGIEWLTFKVHKNEPDFRSWREDLITVPLLDYIES